MRAKPIGLYVHIPFCLKKCAYCDFCSFAYVGSHERKAYVEALCAEILDYKGEGLELDTVFFGGGTPSLLSAEELTSIFDSIGKAFKILPDAEITMEANPKTLKRENLEGYIALGVNRFSLGLQSIHDNEQKILGRIHSYDDFLESYNLLRECGIDNINVDLMYGIPEQTKHSFEQTLSTVLDLEPEHISLYGLILEEGTPLFKNRKHLSFPTEDEECDMYYLAAELLRERGYRHYEISNYSKPGRESRHNLKYWRDEEYIGVGLSAYSYFTGVRYGNTSDMNEYLAGLLNRTATAETIDISTEAYEFVMLALRLAEGFSLEEYRRRFDEDFSERRAKTLESLISGGYAKIEDGRLSLTDKGMYVSNAIITELI